MPSEALVVEEELEDVEPRLRPQDMVAAGLWEWRFGSTGTWCKDQ